jgi:putative tryptophan/tyrosine transport system substrate-binding protein
MKFVTLVGSAGAAWPLAQQRAISVIGFLNPASPDGYRPMMAAFRRGQQEFGYVERLNVVIEYRCAEGTISRLPGMAVDLMARLVAVVAATTTTLLGLGDEVIE